MPASHRRHSEWSPERLKAWAGKIGPNAATLIAVILRDRSHPEQGFRSCLGIMRLAKPHGPEALEAACERALTIGARSYSSVHSILKMEPSRRHRFEPDGERSIVPGPNPPRTDLRSSAAISAAPVTSIDRTTSLERRNDADPPHPGATAPAKA